MRRRGDNLAVARAEWPGAFRAVPPNPALGRRASLPATELDAFAWRRWSRAALVAMRRSQAAPLPSGLKRARARYIRQNVSTGQILGSGGIAHDAHDPAVDIALVFAGTATERVGMALGESCHGSMRCLSSGSNWVGSLEVTSYFERTD